MKYFLHDTSAFDDEKITELYMKFGYEGLGLFYTALEKLGKQEKPVKTDVLKAQLKIGKRLEKCWLFMEQIGIISSNNGESFNEQLLNFSEKYQIKKEKTREKVLQWRKRQEDIESVTGYVPKCNARKVKLSKVKLNKVNNINIPFEDFWNLYDKKVDRKKCEPKWLNLTDIERELCMKNLPAYIQSTFDKKFRRDPETYLNNKSWENEIISPFPSKIPEQPLTYEEMCNRTTNDPDIWKRYKAVKRDGERKAVFYPIKNI